MGSDRPHWQLSSDIIVLFYRTEYESLESSFKDLCYIPDQSAHERCLEQIE